MPKPVMGESTTASYTSLCLKTCAAVKTDEGCEWQCLKSAAKPTQFHGGLTVARERAEASNVCISQESVSVNRLFRQLDFGACRYDLAVSIQDGSLGRQATR